MGKHCLAGDKATEHGIHSRAQITQNPVCQRSSLCAHTRCNVVVTETRGQQAEKNTPDWFRICNSTMIWGEKNAEVLLCNVIDKFDRS